MKYSLPIFLSFFMVISALAQQKEKLTYKKIPQDFKTYFNNEDYKSIYELFSSDFQKHVSDITLKINFRELKQFAGPIKDFKYVPKGAIAYKFDLGGEVFLTILMKPDLKINQLILDRPKVKKQEETVPNLTADSTRLYKGGKKNSTGQEGTYLTTSNGKDNITPLSKFKNLEIPKNNGEVTGRIVVMAKIDRQGKITAATAGTKGSSLFDKDLYLACERALLNASYEPAIGGPEIRTVFVPFTFRIK